MTKRAKNPDDSDKSAEPGGFGEAPQVPLTGIPMSGTMSDWMREVAAEAEAAATDTANPSLTKRVKKSAKAETKPVKTARGTSMGGKAGPKERAAGGLNPVAGLDVGLEDVGSLPQPGVTATVAALERLITEGRPEFLAGVWQPHRPARPEKSEGGI
ncbi:MAG: excinuclease ABC subunit UvrB, partial [Hyphomicrobiales bacterium]|nr:excinuclease ABC subunit UvrB [Hyphomicrobiales bacterium]